MTSPERTADAIQSVVDRIADQAAAEIRALLDRFEQDAAAERESAVSDALCAAEADAQARLSAELERVRAEATATVSEPSPSLASREAIDSPIDTPSSSEPGRDRVAEREAVLAGMERVLAGLQRLDRAKALTEVFDALTDAVAIETARAAVLLVQDGAMRGWRFVGFEPALALGPGVTLDEPGSSAVARALATGETCLAEPGIADGSLGLGAAPLPSGRAGLAVPLRVGGRVVAVLYADDVGEHEHPVPAAWPEVVEVFARHAGRCLEALTAVRTSQLAEMGKPSPSRG